MEKSNIINTKVAPTSDSESSRHDMDGLSDMALMWKIDIRILPITFLFYMLSYLDRINIGNARIQGMQEELKLGVDDRFNTALLLFYALYIPFEIPSNMLMKHVRPSLYLSTLMFLWGISTICTGFVQTYRQLYALRVLLGLFEAGLVPGIVYLTSMYYSRFQYQKRFGLMFTATSVGGAIGGLLAYAIAGLSGKGGYLGWRWIFIIEGAVTCGVALISPFILVDWPNQCRAFTPDERARIQRWASQDTGAYRMDTLDRHSLKRVICDWKIYLGALTYMGLVTSGLALSFFLPTVLKEFGWQARAAQVHTIPVYAVTLSMTLVLCWLSDRVQHRYGFIMFCCIITSIGYAMLFHIDELSRGARYAACFLVAVGGICSGPIAIVFLSNNLAGHYKRSVGSAMQVSFAGFAGIIGSAIYKTNEAPSYPTGVKTGLAMTWVSGLAASLMALGIWLENRKRDRGERDDRLQLPADQVDNLGDDHPGFRFTL